jgi:epoxyqueuosine reductase
MTDMKTKMKEFAEKNGILIGFGRAERFEEIESVLKNTDVPFVNYDVEQRVEPSLTLKGAKSLIAVALPYNKNYVPPDDEKVRAKISVAAVGEDYHTRLADIMQRFSAEFLAEYDYMCFTDTGPLVDREVAKRCGLGFIGKNHSLINPKLGGMLFLGYIITTAEFDEYDKSVNQNCGKCRMCVDACPGGAIGDVFKFENCAAYVTQCKDELTQEQKKIMGEYIYGCDVCQKVCPYNSKKPPEVCEDAFPVIEEIMQMSNKDFKLKYKHTAAGWRGKKVIQRNATVVLENIMSCKDKK